MVQKKIMPSNEQLISISQSIIDELKDVKYNDIYLTIEVDAQSLKKIDEHYFFTLNKDAKEYEYKQASEVIVNVGDLKIKFSLKDEDNKK